MHIHFFTDDRDANVPIFCPMALFLNLYNNDVHTAGEMF